jgi:toxin CcdB
MARLDLYRLPEVDGYVLEVQADLLSTLATAVVVPLLSREDSPTPLGRLNPVFEIDGVPHVMVTQFIAAVPRRELGAPVGSLGANRHVDVTNALDMIFSGC